ncbi:MAG TPA: serine/threonine-protein kinase [Pirellulales bacterium]|nr:serine/threonine-protein kinase [Pirellulales bacterium]
MQLAAVSLDEDEDHAMNLRATQAEPEAAPRPAAMKFTYASGSRPLDGYTLKRGIGRGGFGEVYYATSDAGKELALKLIRRNLDVELRGVTQCLNLKHPNLLSLFDVKQDETGDSWVVMEYVAGDSLEAVLERHPDGLPRQELLAWFYGIAAGVTYLHDHGIVHRDLKPGNIFSDEGIVKIGDYGLSKFISASRRSGQTESVGTVHYMAPEIGNGRYGKEIDIYALGIILYEMLTGHVPFEGESVGEVLMKHLTAEPNLDGVEEPYRSAIAKTLTKSPDTRIKTVGELMALLPAGPLGTFVASNGKKTASDAGATCGVGVPPAAAHEGGNPPSSAPEAGVTTATPQARRPHHKSDIVSAVLVADEEPIARAFRSAFDRFSTAWNTGRIQGPGKVAIILASAYILVMHGIVIIPTAVSLLMVYACYYAIRSVVMACRTPSAEPAAVAAQRPVAPAQPAAPVAPAAPAVPRQAAAHAGFRNYRRAAADRSVAPPKTARQRVEELTGSLLASTAVAAAMSVFLSVVHAKTLQPGQLAWLLVVSTLGSWLVLIPSKLWEGHEGDSTLRRLTLMLLGLGLGAAAWGVKDFLLVPLTADWRDPAPVLAFTEEYVSARFYDSNGAPSLVGHMAYFAFLMLLVRWWKQADPLRPSRLRLWPVVVAIFWAWLLYSFLPFPQPWGTMVAVSMSVAVQVSASWERGKRRAATL